VAFLSCGSALQPILPKSQCWCISETNDRFVLQIRRPQYWRIEIPVSDSEDAALALVLRDVLDSILLFEKTECPFQRTFTVALPERPQTPVRKKPWTPVGKNLIWSPFASETTPSPSLSGRIVSAKRPNTASADGFSSRPGSAAGIAHEKSLDSPTESPLTSKAINGSSRLALGSESAMTPSVTTEELEEQVQGLRVNKPQGAVLDISQALAQVLSENRESPLVEQAGLKTATATSDCDVSSQKQLPAIQNLAGSPLSKYQNPCVSPLVGKLETDIWAIQLSERTANQHGKETAPTATLDNSRTALPVAVTERQNICKFNKPAEFSIGQSRELEAVCDSGDEGPRSFEGAGSLRSVNLKKKKMSHLLAGRSVSLRPQLTIITPPPPPPPSPPSPPPPEPSQPLVTQRKPLKEQQALPELQPAPEVPEEASDVESTDSFHSVLSWHSPITPLPPSPPSSRPSPPVFPHPHEDIIIPRLRQTREADASDSIFSPRTEVTVRPSSADAMICSPGIASPASFPIHQVGPMSPRMGQAPGDSSWTSAMPEQPTLRRRPRSNTMTFGRRGLSPLPPAADLFSSPVRRRPPSRLETVRRLPSFIINKTVEILLSPPSHLVHIMLKVAARIAAGEWTGLVLGLGEGGESIPVHWDYSDDELSSWEDDDDFFFSMGPFANKRVVGDCDHGEQRTGLGSKSDSALDNDRSWEID
jgi:hypothetical protein